MKKTKEIGIGSDGSLLLLLLLLLTYVVIVDGNIVVIIIFGICLCTSLSHKIYLDFYFCFYFVHAFVLWLMGFVFFLCLFGYFG